MMVCLALCNCRTNSTAAGTGSTPPCSLGCTKVPSRSKQKRMVRDTSQKGCRKNGMRRCGVGVGVGVGVAVAVAVAVVVVVVVVVVGVGVVVVVVVVGGGGGGGGGKQTRPEPKIKVQNPPPKKGVP